MPDKQDASAGNYSLATAVSSIRIDLWKWLALPVVGVTLAMVSWQKWQDLIVDFGQQVYVPWQLAEGQILYRDIFYIYGPLCLTCMPYCSRYSVPAFWFSPGLTWG